LPALLALGECFSKTVMGLDLNQRISGYEPAELPGASIQSKGAASVFTRFMRAERSSRIKIAREYFESFLRSGCYFEMLSIASYRTAIHGKLNGGIYDPVAAIR
jgi:hypothetical protein